MADEADRKNPLASLNESDREFVLQFVLASGSLKELAQLYGVSYPTIRAKLDRLIERLREIMKGRAPDPMADLLADYIEKGEVAHSAARKILELYRNETARAKGK